MNKESFFKVLPQIFKYQIITKLLFVLFIFPLWSFSSWAFANSTDVGVLTNANLMEFLMSIKGIIFGVISFLIILVGVTLEICGFVTISARGLQGQGEVSYGQLLKSNIMLLPKMFGLGGIVVVLYAAVIVPLTGMGNGISFLNWIKIPNFISSVINGNLMFSVLYTALIILLTIISFYLIFTFHFMVLHGEKAINSAILSFKLIKSNFKKILLDNFKVFFIIWLISIAIVAGTMLFFIWLMSWIEIQGQLSRMMAVFMIILQSAVMLFVQMLSVPLQIHYLTEVFYKYTAGIKEINYPVLKPKSKKSILDIILSRRKTIIVFAIISGLGISYIIGTYFDEILRNDGNIQVISHRAGGNMAPENSMAGLKAAIAQGASYSEIDVQRTMDGHYIVNHDEDFKRILGDKRSSREMTLEEIKKLKIIVNGRETEQHISTVEEMFKESVGKIGLFVELKGSTADMKMAEDMIELAKKYKITEQIVLVSLDYKLIEMIETRYPHINTGYIYFLSIGDVSNLYCDYLIMEEIDATDEKIDQIHSADKKAIVWTVNEYSSILKFTGKNIDGIITDNVEDVQAAIKDRKNRTAKDIILDMLIPAE